MSNRYRLHVVAYVLMALMMTAATASAQNLIVNPGFEAAGPTGGVPTSWIGFGEVHLEKTLAPQFVAYEGTKLVSIYGNWSGPYNVTGLYQEFATSEGEQWALSAKSRHWSGDPMIGDAVTGNFVVQKLVFKDAGDVEIGAAETIILDGTYATDTWFDNDPVIGIAPAGAVQVEAMILYVQANEDGGAAHIDLVELYYQGLVSVDESSWGAIKSLYE